MFFSMGHGKRIVKVGEGLKDHVSVHQALALVSEPTVAPDQTFGYLFTDAETPEFPEVDGIDAKLDALAASMLEPTPEPHALNGALPPIFTYLGQFIDHDLTANTDQDTEASQIDKTPLDRQPRGVIEANVQNGRRGSLALDSLYGDAPNPTAQGVALQAAMRDGPFLREGMTAPIGGPRPVLPRLGGDDLPRIGPLIDAGVVDPSDLPDQFRPDPGDPDDHRRSLALIGDGRNDENLIVAQLHLAFIRYHNAVARTVIRDARMPLDDDEVFRLARKTVIWTYQWLVVNDFLPAICRPQDVDATVAARAPIYNAFLKRLSEGELAGRLPMPLEFSVAAYRFGHTMVRENYDFNLNFGRPGFDQDGERRATLTQLFEFTGRSADGSDPFGPAPGPRLPQNWVIEWNRFVESRPLFRDRSARAIDTLLAPGLFNMIKEEPGVFKQLALRNLRRGYNMNLPSGQAMLDAMRAAGLPLGPTLSKTRLTAGTTGRALRDAGLADATPLWFYVLKEAEEMEGGARLGTVGSFLVADTMVGLLVHDPGSYLHRSGSGGDGRWHPRDGVSPNGAPVTSINALLEAAGVLEHGVPVPASPGPVQPPAGRGAVAMPAAPPSASPAMITAAVDEQRVRSDVLKVFNAAYKPLDVNYEDKAPGDLFGSDVQRWSVHYRTRINLPLIGIYDWDGLTQAERFAVFSQSFSGVYETTVADILKDLGA